MLNENEKKQLVEKLKSLEQKKSELRNKITDKYLIRLKGLFVPGFTGNVQTNIKDGFPFNHNVNYTISLTQEEQNYINRIFDEERSLEYELRKNGIKQSKEG